MSGQDVIRTKAPPYFLFTDPTDESFTLLSVYNDIPRSSVELGFWHSTVRGFDTLSVGKGWGLTTSKEGHNLYCYYHYRQCKYLPNDTQPVTTVTSCT